MVAVKTHRITPERQRLIDGLNANGGRLVANGNGYLTPEDVKTKLNLSAKGVTDILTRAEKDGIIRRTIKGRRTKAIYLVHGKQKVQTTTPTVSKPKAPSKRITPPQVGTQATINTVWLGENGEFHVGFNNEQGAWVATLSK